MARQKPEKIYLTPNEVAEMLMVSTETVRQWSQKGWLEAKTTAGGHRRYLRDSVERFAEERGLNHAPSQSKDLRVLVVDDNRQFADYLVELINGMDDSVTITAVYDGFSAGAQVHTFHPDIILLDLRMPDLNGFEVCQMVKGNVETSAIRILAMTALPTDEDVARILKAGAEVCFAKPIDSDLLLKTISVTKNQTKN